MLNQWQQFAVLVVVSGAGVVPHQLKSRLPEVYPISHLSANTALLMFTRGTNAAISKACAYI